MVAIIKNGTLFQVFQVAGHRIVLNRDLDKRVSAKYNEYLNNPTEELFKELEELEEEVAKGYEYKTAGGYRKILMALDYANEIDEGWRIFDICRAKAS